MPVVDGFCAFILTHGRPDNVKTYQTLRQKGYTGRIVLVVDDGDKSLPRYLDTYGTESVYVFSKSQIALEFDQYDTSSDMRTIVYARNVCFKAAVDLGFSSFIQLDDDYYWFGHRRVNGAVTTRNLDAIFSSLVRFLQDAPRVTSVAFSQGGDHIGGYDPEKVMPRKAMNSFVCLTDRPFKFSGRINEDVNTYVGLGATGHVFLTVPQIQLDQKDTQSNAGGMTDVYLDGGTYIKSFYTVLSNPSCVKVKTVGIHHPRLHHGISWDNAVPKILSESYRK